MSFAQRWQFVAGHSDLRRLWIGRTTSVVGDRMFAVGAIWLAWSLTHSSAGVACIILAESLPFLAWGALRTRVKLAVGVRTLATLDLVRAALLAGLLVLPLNSAVTKALGVGLVAAIAFTTAIFEPAFRTLIPELVPGEGRQAYTSFDLGGRLARIIGPLLAAAITWGGSPRGLLAADIATFLISAVCLLRTVQPSHAELPAQQAAHTAGRAELSVLSRTLIRANGIGTFALIVWWLALPIAAGHHSRGASTYSLCIGACAAGGILANLLLSRSPERHEPVLLCSAGWAVTATCIGALAANPGPFPLQGISLLCGFALGCAALGFSFHAAGLDTTARNLLFQRDQVVMRGAGAAGAVVGGIVLGYSSDVALAATSMILVVFACMIWRSAQTEHGQDSAQTLVALEWSDDLKSI